jgi:hypothetical protein
VTQKAQILFTCTEEFKDALGSFAQLHNLSASLVIRKAVAEYIGYNLEGEVSTDRRRKYLTDEERKNATKERTKKGRVEVAKLLAALEKEQRLADVLGIENSLKRKGVDPNV